MVVARAARLAFYLVLCVLHKRHSRAVHLYRRRLEHHALRRDTAFDGDNLCPLVERVHVDVALIDKLLRDIVLRDGNHHLADESGLEVL